LPPFASKLDMRAAALSDIGLVRNKNEDVFRCDTQRGIFVVADGIGGFQAGEVAAALAAESVWLRLARAVDEKMTASPLTDELYESFCEASERVFDRAQGSDDLRGMACSLLAAIVQQDYCLVAHAGDTRAYLYFDGMLHQITVDDTPVAAMVKRGYLLPEKANSHSMKNFLIKSVGSQPQIEPNLARFPVKKNERLLLCSDGLWGMVDHESIRNILTSYYDPDQICHELIQSARDKGGKDNITVVLVEIGDKAADVKAIDKTERMPSTYL